MGGKPAASPTVTLAQAGAQANALRGQWIVPDSRGKVGDAGCTAGEPALLQLPFSDGLSLACCAALTGFGVPHPPDAVKGEMHSLRSPLTAPGACGGWPLNAPHNRRMQRQKC